MNSDANGRLTLLRSDGKLYDIGDSAAQAANLSLWGRFLPLGESSLPRRFLLVRLALSGHLLNLVQQHRPLLREVPLHTPVPHHLL